MIKPDGFGVLQLAAFTGNSDSYGPNWVRELNFKQTRCSVD